MCGQYCIDRLSPDLLPLVLEAARLNRHSRTDVRPTDWAPVIAASGPCVMQWGFTLPGRKGAIINARSETVANSPLFSASLCRRCVLPASSYYEWDRHRNRYTISREDGLFLAGIFRLEDDNVRRFCILTRPPSEALAPIHDRMPLLLDKASAAAWLDSSLSPEAAARLPARGLSAFAPVAQLSLFDGPGSALL